MLWASVLILSVRNYLFDCYSIIAGVIFSNCSIIMQCSIDNYAMLC